MTRVKAPRVQLATLVDELPRGPEWAYEPKYDGYRLTAAKTGRTVRLFSRNGLDWTAKIPFIAEEFSRGMPADSVFDGELVAEDRNGKISFSALQKALNEKGPARLILYVFDLLKLRGRDTRPLPRPERRALLSAALKKSRHIRPTPQFPASRLDDLLTLVEREGLEGIIAKNAARYSAGRGRSWLKFKFERHEEFSIIGFSPHSKKSREIGSLLLGLPVKGKRFWYCGKVGTGFSAAERLKLRRLLEPQRTREARIINAELIPRKSVLAPSQFVCEVKFTEWTEDGLLRHPSYLGIRPDKKTADISIKNSSHPFVREVKR